jgi:hypothetical protein
MKGLMMDKDYFDKYFKERYIGQVAWYDKKAVGNQKKYRFLQWSLIILSAITPVLIAHGFDTSSSPNLKWLTIIIAVLVTVFSTALKTFKFQENWINYRTTCETLKKEEHFFNANLGDYSDVKDKESLFIERVEILISRENTLWLTAFKKKDKSSH